MTDPAADRLSRIKAAVVGYLERHPNARDSARGIRECWLPRDLHGVSEEEIEHALHMLEDEGRVVAVYVLHNPTLFARARCPDPYSD